MMIGEGTGPERARVSVLAFPPPRRHRRTGIIVIFAKTLAKVVIPVSRHYFRAGSKDWWQRYQFLLTARTAGPCCR